MNNTNIHNVDTQWHEAAYTTPLRAYTGSVCAHDVANAASMYMKHAP